jgi:flagellar biosynthesis protein FlhA
MEARVTRRGVPTEWIVPALFLGLVGTLVLPLPAWAMDGLIAVNFALSGVVLATAASMRRPLDFSVFPALVLGTTLLRLGLNVASTRLILGTDASSALDAAASAGSIIEAFGLLGAGSNPVIGLSVFAMLVVVQFVVVTRGSVRMGEVAARFALDALPGRQMAIDADLSSGAIDAIEARRRRDELLREADFHGAMDGAGRFVRGDAVAGLVIVTVNIVGGFLVGVLQKGWGASESLRVFALLAVGDGLVTQIPAFLVATASGLVSAKAASGESLGREIPSQLSARPAALWIVAVLLAGLSLTPLPATPLLAAAALVAAAAVWTTRVGARQQGRRAERGDDGVAPIEDALLVEPLSVDLGLGLLSLASGPGGTFLEQVAMVRRRLALELGVLVPSVRIRDDASLDPRAYCIRLRDAVVAAGSLRPGGLLVLDPQGGLPDVPGEAVADPTHGLPAVWASAENRSALEARGFAVSDASGTLAAHLAEVLRRRAWELLSVEEVGRMLDRLRGVAPRAAQLISGPSWPIDRLRDLLQALLREGLPVRDLERIAEVVHAADPRDPDDAVRRARAVGARSVCERLLRTGAAGTRQIEAVWVGAESLEGDAAMRVAERSVVPDAAIAERLVRSAAPGLRRLLERGAPAVVVTPDRMRGIVSRALRGRLGEVTVLARGEIPSDCELHLESATEPVGA